MSARPEWLNQLAERVMSPLMSMGAREPLSETVQQPQFVALVEAAEIVCALAATEDYEYNLDGGACLFCDAGMGVDHSYNHIATCPWERARVWFSRNST